MSRKFHNDSARENNRLWPRVLLALATSKQPLNSVEIAQRIQEDPRRVYASMASLGRSSERWWILPVSYWSRKGQFEITEAGRSALQQLVAH